MASAYINELTNSIQDGAQLLDILSHSQLLNTVRNEASILLNFFFPPEEMQKSDPNLPNLVQLIDLALDPTTNPDPAKYPIFQINRNAANVLSYASARFFELHATDPKHHLFTRLRRQLFIPEIRKNRMFLGHYLRIVETTLRIKPNIFLQNDLYNDNFNPDELLAFLCRNSDCTACSTLLSYVIDDFSSFFHDPLYEALRIAAIAVLNLTTMRDQLSISLSEFRFQIFRKEMGPNNFIEKLASYQPMNCLHQQIPLPYYLSPNLQKLGSRKIIDPKFLAELKNKLDFFDFFEPDEAEQDASNQVYESIEVDPDLPNDIKDSSESSHSDHLTLRQCNQRQTYKERLIILAINILSCVKNFIEILDQEKYANLRKDEYLRCLLTCGLFSDRKSPLADMAYSIIYDLLNTRHEQYTELNFKLPPIVDEFAQYVNFDPFDLPFNSIAALKVFWNHRYPDPDQKPEDLITHPRISHGCKYIRSYTQAPGVTPLQMLLPAVLTEPPLSSELNNIYLSIITSLKADYTELFHTLKIDQSSRKTNIQKMIDIDTIFYELRRYQFKLQPDSNENLYLISALPKVMALPYSDNFFKTHAFDDEKHRTMTNPLIFELSMLYNEEPLFLLKEDELFRKYCYEFEEKQLNATDRESFMRAIVEIADFFEKFDLNQIVVRTKKARRNTQNKKP